MRIPLIAVSMAMFGVAVGIGRRAVNRAANRAWPSRNPRVQSYAARLLSLATVVLGGSATVVLMAVFRAPAWVLLVAAVPFIIIGETKIFP